MMASVGECRRKVQIKSRRMKSRQKKNLKNDEIEPQSIRFFESANLMLY